MTGEHHLGAGPMTDPCPHTVTVKDGTVLHCRQPHPKCVGHKRIRQDESIRWHADTNPIIAIRPCMGWPRKGTKACRLHGGSAPQVLAAAENRKTEAKVRKLLETYGRPVDTNPVDALLDEVKWTAGHVAWLRQQVQTVEADALTWGRTKQEDHQATEFPGINTTEAAAVNVWLDLYMRERKHLVDVCKSAIAAGIAERQVRLAEQQGEMLASVIKAILDDLNLTEDQAQRAPGIAARHLRAVS